MLARGREKRRSEHGEDHLTSGVIGWRSQVGHMRIFFAQCLDKRVLMKFFWHTLILPLYSTYILKHYEQLSGQFCVLSSEVRGILSVWHIASLVQSSMESVTKTA